MPISWSSALTMFICNQVCFKCYQLVVLLGCDRNLMARQDLKDLGFKEHADSAAAGKEEDLRESSTFDGMDRRKQGFIAGMQR